MKNVQVLLILLSCVCPIRFGCAMNDFTACLIPQSDTPAPLVRTRKGRFSVNIDIAGTEIPADEIRVEQLELKNNSVIRRWNCLPKLGMIEEESQIGKYRIRVFAKGHVKNPIAQSSEFDIQPGKKTLLPKLIAESSLKPVYVNLEFPPGETESTHRDGFFEVRASSRGAVLSSFIETEIKSKICFLVQSLPFFVNADVAGFKLYSREVKSANCEMKFQCAQSFHFRVDGLELLPNDLHVNVVISNEKGGGRVVVLGPYKNFGRVSRKATIGKAGKFVVSLTIATRLKNNVGHSYKCSNRKVIQLSPGEGKHVAVALDPEELKIAQSIFERFAK